MKIAYLILAHTDPQHLKRLIDALYVDDITDFYVHIDKKVSNKPFLELKNNSQITFCNTRFCVHWGGVEHV